MKKIIIAVICVISLVAFVFCACTKSTDDTEAYETTSYQSSNVNKPEASNENTESSKSSALSEDKQANNNVNSTTVQSTNEATYTSENNESYKTTTDSKVDTKTTANPESTPRNKNKPIITPPDFQD